jgi:flagellar motor switch protein FliG
MRTVKEQISGRQKAAMLLVALGADYAAEIMKRLSVTEVELLTLEIARLETVSVEQVEEIMQEFSDLSAGKQYLTSGGMSYARDLLYATLGADRAERILSKLQESLQPDPFETLRDVHPSQLLEFLRNEHPQTIALVLAHLPSPQAAELLSHLPPEVQPEVAHRLVTMDLPSTEVLQEVERQITQRLAIAEHHPTSTANYDGLETLVQILNNAPRSTEKSVLQALETRDEVMVNRVRQALFIFEDLQRLDNRSIQRILREVDTKELGLALRGASEELRERIFTNMSSRASEILREDMEYMGPVKLRDVDAAQKRIVNIVRTLEEADEIVVSRGGEDEVIV